MTRSEKGFQWSSTTRKSQTICTWPPSRSNQCHACLTSSRASILPSHCRFWTDAGGSNSDNYILRRHCPSKPTRREILNPPGIHCCFFCEFSVNTSIYRLTLPSETCSPTVSPVRAQLPLRLSPILQKASSRLVSDNRIERDCFFLHQLTTAFQNPQIVNKCCINRRLLGDNTNEEGLVKACERTNDCQAGFCYDSARRLSVHREKHRMLCECRCSCSRTNNI
jgi:hypothetical protein